MLARLPKPLARRLKYYRAVLATDEIRLEGIFAPTALDGQKGRYAAMLWRGICLRGEDGGGGGGGGEDGGGGDDGSSSRALPAPPPLPEGMSIFNAAAFAGT